MGIAWSVILFLLLAAFLVIGVPLIYLIAFYQTANRRLAESKTGSTGSHKPMMSPLKFTLIYLALLFGSIFALVWLNTVRPSTQTVTTQRDFICEYTGDRIKDSVFGNFSPDEEIAGYRRTEQTDGNFRFVTYTNEMHSDLFASHLVYAEYTGPRTDCSFGFRLDYSPADGSKTGYCQSGLEDNGIWIGLDGKELQNNAVLQYCILSETDSEKTDADDDLPDLAEEFGTLIVPITGSEE